MKTLRRTRTPLVLAVVMGLAVVAMAVAAYPAEKTAEKTYYTCSMHPQVMQEKPGYCPICAMKLAPIAQGAGSQAGQGTSTGEAGERKILYYWDPMMNPPYTSDKPGKSPMGMDLVPVYEDEVHAGEAVVIDPVVTQNMGIRVAEVTQGPLHASVRTVGYLRAAEPKQRDITLKVGGYIENLAANTEGMPVKKGSVLFDLYSPDVVTAEQEMLAAKRSLDRLPAGADNASQANRADAEALLADARKRLELWDVPADEIDAVLKSGEVGRTVAFRSPVAGFLTEKEVVEGAAVEPGMRLFRIVDQSELWLDAQIYENQLGLVKVGSEASAEVAGAPDASIKGKVIFMDPEVNPETRAVTARISFPNPDFKLKPGMYATVEVDVLAAADAVQVPREAVIDTGRRQIAFVSLGEGRFEPRVLRVGTETADGLVEVLGGLAPGDMVVTSGQFLLDTESRTREAIAKMTEERMLKPAGEAAGGTGAAGAGTGATGAGQAAAVSPTASAAAGVLTPRVDDVVKTYLEIAGLLASDTAIPAAQAKTLASRADSLNALAQACGGPVQSIAKAIADNARLVGQGGLEDQRKVFKTISDNVIKLVDQVTPSKAVGEQLYVVHCPMYTGDWLQTDQAVKNPFYGKMMLTCGSVQRTITTVK